MSRRSRSREWRWRCVAGALAGLLAVACLGLSGCRRDGVAVDAQTQQPASGRVVFSPSVERESLSFSGALAEVGGKTYLVLRIENCGSEDVVVRREPDEYSIEVWLGRPADGPLRRAGYVSCGVRPGPTTSHVVSVKIGAGGRAYGVCNTVAEMPGHGLTPPQKHDPDHVMVLSPMDSVTRWVLIGDGWPGEHVARASAGLSYEAHGVDESPEPYFSGGISLPEIPVFP